MTQRLIDTETVVSIKLGFINAAWAILSDKDRSYSYNEVVNVALIAEEFKRIVNDNLIQEPAVEEKKDKKEKKKKAKK